MKITISGSWKKYKIRDWKLKQSKEKFARACFDIGFKIAEHGHSVIVGSQSPNTADLYIVEGIVNYVEEYGKNKPLYYPLVYILRPNDELFPFRRLEEQFHIFSRYRKEQPDWNTAHLLAVKEANVVLIVGGAKSSYATGLATITNGKKLVPVGSFGGAGRKLLDYILGESSIETKEEYQRLYGSWTNYLLQVTLDLLGVCDDEKPQNLDYQYPKAPDVWRN